MKAIYCVYCKKQHTAFNWRMQYNEKKKKVTWYCEKYFKPTAPEFIPEKMKQDRNTYAKSLLQPYRGTTPSAEYIESYGTGRFHPDEVKKAKPVWADVLPTGWRKSK